MQTISQVAKLTGISVRTLQYYDEIGLLKPSELTQSGYRLYNDEALQKLQEILFLRELGFKLKEINKILDKPDFDRLEAFRKQKELLLLKRNRTNRLIQLLTRLEKGEQCMSFKEFDLSDYIEALESFKNNSADDIIRHWGNIENFDLFIQKIREDETEVARLAIKEYGSVEKYTKAMKYNLEHFSEIMEKQLSQLPAATEIDDLYQSLTADLKKEVSSDEIQQIVGRILLSAYGNVPAQSLYNNYCDMIITIYSKDYFKTIFDTKHGAGASDYVVKAFQYYRGKPGT